MGLESVNYQCPACGGPLRYDGGKGKLVCDHCDSEFEVTQIEAMFATAEAKAEERAAGAGAQTLDGGYVCASCGAQLMTDGTVAVSRCPYCGNQTMQAATFTGDFKPDLVIPFKLDHKAAVAALDEHYKGKILLPREFKTGNHIDEVQGVYVPFWLYDSNANGSATFEATNTRSYMRGDDEIIETDHYTCERSGSMAFTLIPVDGSTRMPDGHMDSIEPYDYQFLVTYSSAYLPGFLANRWDEDADACRCRAEHRVTKSVENALGETVTGYATVDCTSSNVDCGWHDEKCALFPVWMLSTSWEGQNFLFAMNGQTGRLVGDLPISKPKLIAICAVVFAVLFGGLWVGMDGASVMESDNPLWGLAMIVLIPVIITVIVGAVLVGQMKSAIEAGQADSYLDRGTFQLASQSDTYTHTTTQVIHHEKKK